MLRRANDERNRIFRRPFAKTFAIGDRGVGGVRGAQRTYGGGSPTLPLAAGLDSFRRAVAVLCLRYLKATHRSGVSDREFFVLNNFAKFLKFW